MRYLYLSVFIISSAIHLFASYKNKKLLRNNTKGLILFSLLAWYAECVGAPQWLPVAAITASWLGDLLLIPKGVKWFAAGGICFTASHVFFILCYAPRVEFSAIPLWGIAASALVYFTAVCLVSRGMKEYLPKQLFPVMFGYLLVNATMNCFALYQLWSLPCAATAITFLGAILFFASDSTLFYVRFKKNSVWKNHFFVMLTYITAEFLIVQGLILLAV